LLLRVVNFIHKNITTYLTVVRYYIIIKIIIVIINPVANNIISNAQSEFDKKRGNMSVGGWDTKLVNFAKASLVEYNMKESASPTANAAHNEKEDYYRSLVACVNIFTSEKTSTLASSVSLDDDLLFTIQVYYPEYGSAILTSEVISDPLTWKI
jgi:hypothetical protein